MVLVKTSSVYHHAPPAVGAQMVETILLDHKEILPCAAFAGVVGPGAITGGCDGGGLNWVTACTGMT